MMRMRVDIYVLYVCWSNVFIQFFMKYKKMKWSFLSFIFI